MKYRYMLIQFKAPNNNKPVSIRVIDDILSEFPYND